MGYVITAVIALLVGAGITYKMWGPPAERPCFYRKKKKGVDRFFLRAGGYADDETIDAGADLSTLKELLVQRYQHWQSVMSGAETYKAEAQQLIRKAEQEAAKLKREAEHEAEYLPKEARAEAAALQIKSKSDAQEVSRKARADARQVKESTERELDSKKNEIKDLKKTATELKKEADAAKAATDSVKQDLKTAEKERRALIEPLDQAIETKKQRLTSLQRRIKAFDEAVKAEEEGKTPRTRWVLITNSKGNTKNANWQKFLKEKLPPLRITGLNAGGGFLLESLEPLPMTFREFRDECALQFQKSGQNARYLLLEIPEGAPVDNQGWLDKTVWPEVTRWCQPYPSS